MKERNGELIELDYEGFVVKGHVTKAELAEVVNKAYGKSDLFEDGEEVEHKWARWIPDSKKIYDMVLLFFSEPGKGAFPVTVWEG